MRKAAKGLRKVLKTVDVLATSPLLRAKQTAEIVAKAYGDTKPLEVDALSPGSRPAELLKWLKSNTSNHIALIGHEPHLSMATSTLLTGVEKPFMTLKKGGACLLEFPADIEAGRAKLLCTLSPSQLRRLS